MTDYYFTNILGQRQEKDSVCEAIHYASGSSDDDKMGVATETAVIFYFADL